MNKKKQGRPRSETRMVAVNIRLIPETLDAIDAVKAPGEPRNVVIRRLLNLGLKVKTAKTA